MCELKNNANDTKIANVNKAIVYAMESMGWELLSVDINAHAGSMRIESRRFDGLLVTLDYRNGKSTVTRERLLHRRVSYRGMVHDMIDTEFLGRQKFDGVRPAMRCFANYVEDNALHESPTRVARGLMTAWLSLLVRGYGGDTPILLESNKQE